jgi:hypothetical protein
MNTLTLENKSILDARDLLSVWILLIRNSTTQKLAHTNIKPSLIQVAVYPPSTTKG